MNRRKFIRNGFGLTLAGALAPSFIAKSSELFAKENLETILYKPLPGLWKNDEINIAWIGHSTILINLHGKVILTDPVLFESIGVYLFGSTIGKIRSTLPALDIDEIPQPDLVLISHAHMDHMDYKTLKTLTEMYPDKLDCITAFNTKDIIDDLNWKSIRELDWGETTHLDGFKVKGIEVKHDGFRLPGEMDRADGHMLYGRSYNGYILESKGKKILFGGDTAFTDKLKRHKNENVDVAIMPIGGYIPHHHRHCNESEALVMASEHLGAKYFIPIHTDTFKSEEGLHTPIDIMMKLVRNFDIKIGLSEIGQTFTLKT